MEGMAQVTLALERCRYGLQTPSSRSLLNHQQLPSMSVEADEGASNQRALRQGGYRQWQRAVAKAALCRPAWRRGLCCKPL